MAIWRPASGDAHGPQQPFRLLIRAGRLGNLPTDPHSRIERRHRILESGPELFAPDPAVHSAGPLTMSWPQTSTRPDTLGRGSAGISPSSDRPSTLLPDPDSPASPRISPARIPRLMPHSAWMSRLPRGRKPPGSGHS